MYLKGTQGVRGSKVISSDRRSAGPSPPSLSS